jgi:hypothetical protein
MVVVAVRIPVIAPGNTGAERVTGLSLKYPSRVALARASLATSNLTEDAGHLDESGGLVKHAGGVSFDWSDGWTVSARSPAIVIADRAPFPSRVLRTARSTRLLRAAGKTLDVRSENWA